MANSSGLLIIERILRDRQSIWEQVADERNLGTLSRQMLLSSAIALACYGAVLGAFHSVLMSLTSAVKLPLLFLITLAICLPTLYFLNLIFGARLSLKQSVAMVMVAITVIAMLAVAFAPISLFFLITAPDYTFFKLLNVAILGISALIGLRFLTGGMTELQARGLLGAAGNHAGVPAGAAGPAQQSVPAQGATPAQVAASAEVGVPAQTGTPGNGAVTATTAEATAQAERSALPAVAAQGPFAVPAQQQVTTQPVMQPAGFQPGHPLRVPPLGAAGERPAGMTLLYVWIVLFGFVGTQLAWTLRPFFGSPDQDFALFRSIEGNFYAEIIQSIGWYFS